MVSFNIFQPCARARKQAVQQQKATIDDKEKGRKRQTSIRNSSVLLKILVDLKHVGIKKYVKSD